jgi:hypothetical protein
MSNPVHDVRFDGRTPTCAELLTAASSSAIGAARLIERSRSGNPAEAAGNAKCAAMWLKFGAEYLERYAEQRKHEQQ